ncbi:hypothetical protein acsn021_20160 [Anaerocolumna cellulosilytica]|uniref:Uncharacterized protein n=1 Tax=Anaerocolumna cellulosilytica TaxID=433286 RepID=A0A6S6R305_9FIRM|nr:hypothetical protein acsn021_20160 [Anaerocolumna cellulosilytica]
MRADSVVGTIDGVVDGSIVVVIVGDAITVAVGAVVKLLGAFTLSDFLHPLSININVMNKIIYIYLFFFTLLSPPRYSFESFTITVYNLDKALQL